MTASVEEFKKAVKKCYPNLLELLPISKLIERFLSHELLSFDRKSELDKLNSPKDKIRYFLDEILIPGLNINYTGHFDEMVNMMKGSDDVLVKLLVKKLIPNASSTLTPSVNATDASTTALTSISIATTSTVTASDVSTTASALGSTANASHASTTASISVSIATALYVSTTASTLASTATVTASNSPSVGISSLAVATDQNTGSELYCVIACLKILAF